MTVENDIYRTLSERGIKQESYEQLLNHGRRWGRLSRDEVIDVIPDTEFDGGLIEEFVGAIAEEGIEIIEPEANEREPFPVETEGIADLEEIERGLSEIDLTGIDVDDVLRMYLREAAQIPLLTASEEVELARRIESCRMAYEELGRGEVPPQRHRELERVIEEGRIAREHLIRANARLVVSVAKRYVGRGLPFSDLIQEGNIGLMRAIRHFDYQRGFKFSTYATWWIRQAVSRALADQSRTIRLPAYISDQMGRMRRTQLELQQRLGRAPSNEELGSAMGLSADKIEQMVASLSQPMSLETPVGEEDDAEFGEMLEDTSAIDPEEAVSALMDNADVRRRLEALPPREREVIELRYGLAGEEAMTLAQVGARMGITRERARQLEMQALDRMRNPEAAQRKRRGPAPREYPSAE